MLLVFHLNEFFTFFFCWWTEWNNVVYSSVGFLVGYGLWTICENRVEWCVIWIILSWKFYQWCRNYPKFLRKYYSVALQPIRAYVYYAHLSFLDPFGLLCVKKLFTTKEKNHGCARSRVKDIWKYPLIPIKNVRMIKVANVL